MSYEFECWKPIKGFEGLYDISNYGRVYSYPRPSTKGGILKPKESKPYSYLKLSKGKCRKTVKIHQLVADAFIPNPYKLPMINHKDCNTHNNCVWNLQWCTSAYNNNYNGCKSKMVETRNDNNSYGSEKPVLQYTLDGKFVAKYKSLQEASRITGIQESSISCVCNKKTRKDKDGYTFTHKSAGGFIFKFAA